MTPEYDPSIPERNDTWAKWQASILENIQSLYNSFEVNHVALDASADAGNHTKVELVQQSTDIQTPTTALAIYNKLVADQTNQTFVRYQGNGTAFQYSNYQLYSINSPNSNYEFYFTFLPGGVVLYFGKTLLGSVLNYIDLQPAICTNISSVFMTQILNVGSQAPRIQLALNPQGKYNRIYPFGPSSSAVGAFYYMVTGNL